MITLTVKGFQKEIDKVQKQILAVKQEQLYSTAKRLVKELREATPVDTGRARDGWDYEIVGDILYITNKVSYMKDLNAGMSPQAPPAFIEQVVMQQPKITVHGEIVKYQISVS